MIIQSVYLEMEGKDKIFYENASLTSTRTPDTSSKSMQ